MKKYILGMLFVMTMVLTACTAKEVTVTFDSDGGTVVASQTFEEGGVVTVPANPVKEGFDFVYWYADDSTTAYSFKTAVDENVTLTALWDEIEEYTVTFDSMGGDSVANQTVTEGDLVTEPEAIEKDLFNFVHWYLTDSATAFDFTTVIDSDIELKALWIEKEVYTVTFDSMGGDTVENQSVTEGNLITEPDAIEKDLYNFVHWYVTDSATAFDFTTVIDADLELKALWTEKDVYTVAFSSFGGTVVANQNVVDGQEATEPPAIEKTGYIFLYWYRNDDSVPYDFSTPVEGNVFLNAKWEAKTEYLVTLETEFGGFVSDVTVYEGETVNLPLFLEDDFNTFVRWYLDDMNVAYDSSTPVMSDLTITALWTQKDVYTFTFNANGGTTVNDQTVVDGFLALEPSEPYLYGNTFEYWYETDDTVPFDFSAPVTGDVNLQALWVTASSYNVNFYNVDTLVDTVSVFVGETVTAPADPDGGADTFVYWYETDNTTPFYLTTPITGDVDLYAKFGTVTDRQIFDDVAAYQATLVDAGNKLPKPARGAVNAARLYYYSESPYISPDGVVLNLPNGVAEGTTGSWKVKFVLDGITQYFYFDIELQPVQAVEIAQNRVLPFINLTTEYDVAEKDVTLYFEQDGNVPYVKMSDFFNLLQGFIDPTIEMTFTIGVDSLEIFYQYYDEDEDYTYDLILTIDATENTISTNDPGFYWAYIYSTETNYGRHIEYVQDHPNESYLPGNDVVYDLDDYNMDIVMYDGELLLPYYMANQLFAGSAYYNVYYNYDGLYGIYSLPGSGSKELRTILRSTMNNNDIPADVLLHTFDMLAFDLDNLYGLKDIMDVDTYYDLLYSLSDDLLVSDPEDFDVAIRDLLLKEIDEPHTSYGYQSYYNNFSTPAPATNNLNVYGPRFQTWYYAGLVDTDDAIGAKWGEAASGWNVTVRPDYWFLTDNIVMLSLDGFSTADIEESEVYDGLIPADMMDVSDMTTFLPIIAQGNKFFYYNNSGEENNVLDIMVKGVDASYVDTYEAALLALGYTFVQEETSDALKTDGYYALTVTEGADAGDYQVIVHYDAEFDLFHVGIANALPAAYTNAWLVTPQVRNLIDADSAVYMEFMLQEIEELHPDITDIILDISWNTGGNVGALYRVLGFITDEPFEVSGMDGDTGGASTNYVDIVGVPDYSHLNWHLLTTPTSFSAANSLANIFKVNELGDIIGVTTGGGACSITPILLPNGTAFTMSSNNISAYRTGSGTTEDPYEYHNVEFGITPDYEIDTEDIFNTTILLDIINGTE